MTAPTPQPPARIPEHLVVRRLMDVSTGAAAWTLPKALWVARDTREVYIDMEHETDEHIDWMDLSPEVPMLQVIPLADGTVAAGLHGYYPVRPVETIPFDLTSDMRVVSRFDYFPHGTVESSKRRHPAGKKRRWGK